MEVCMLDVQRMGVMKEGRKVFSLLVGQEDDPEEVHLTLEEYGYSLLMKLKLEGDEIQASLDSVVR
jgi:hypothetical protein